MSPSETEEFLTSCGIVKPTPLNLSSMTRQLEWAEVQDYISYLFACCKSNEIIFFPAGNNFVYP
jgi:hypothetical protein